jgi:hypothetical protein
MDESIQAQLNKRNSAASISTTAPETVSVCCAVMCCAVLCAGAGFLPWMPSFNKWFGGLKPITLTASVIFFPPFIREIAGWAGFRQVCRGRDLSAGFCEC